MRTSPGNPGDRNTSPSPPTDRVVAVIELLAAEPDNVFTLTAITRKLGLSKATCYAILSTLINHGWVVRASSAGYSCGPAIPKLMHTTSYHALRPCLVELADATGTPVSLGRRDNGRIDIVDAVGKPLSGPSIEAGFRLPLLAPFGRDYVAWSTEAEQQAWLRTFEKSTSILRTRIRAVLRENRSRGYIIERLSPEYIQVYSALRSLDSLGQPDAITAKLAGALAELSLIDYLPDELASRKKHPVATISAPIMDANGIATMALTAAPFTELSTRSIHKIGTLVAEAARSLSGLPAVHVSP